MKYIILILILSSISWIFPSKSNIFEKELQEFKKSKIEYRYIPRLDEPEHAFIIIPDPCPWLRKDYVPPYIPDFKLDMPGLPQQEEKKYYKKIPWG
jgi:hypothetical protein